MQLRPQNHAEFSRRIQPHLDAAYSLARWLVGNDADAQDILQDALVRAFRFCHTAQSDNCLPWLLTIVRHTTATWLHQNRRPGLQPYDETLHDPPDETPSPAETMMGVARQQNIQSAIEQLPPEFREVIVLRELQGLAYKQIADITQVSLGTVMSRLSRARKKLIDSPLLIAEKERAP